VKAKAAAHPGGKDKSAQVLDVLVIGEHPSAYLAAMLLHAAEKAKPLRVAHCTIPDQNEADRLVVINPQFFSLHPPLESLRRKLDMCATYGLQFVSDDPTVRSEHRSKSTLAYTASSRATRSEMAKVAENAGVQCFTPKSLEIRRVDENGMDVQVHKQSLRAKSLLLAGHLPRQQQQMLGINETWPQDVIHRYSYIKLPGKKFADLGNRPVIPMSLNLADTLCWGWLLPGPKYSQIAIAQPLEILPRVSPAQGLAHWAKVLAGAGLLLREDIPLDHIESIDLPLTGALMSEGVGNRTLLIGPAGGFYCQSAEDIYPNCWSAVFAVEAIRKALKEPHLQDALNPYRSKWRTTLGQYLRGPQQDLRFLLPLIYRNEVMTTRLTESILQGKSVVR
jgi:flavin-dependent dehydrogenase